MKIKTVLHELREWSRMGFLKKLALISAISVNAFSVSAMDRWDALSMQESGNDDNAVGPQGEVSRYQILPAVWQKSAGHWKDKNGQTVSPTNQVHALFFAKVIMFWRVIDFSDTHHRNPTDLEWVLLWKCPSRVEHPSPAKLEQAQRVVNLINRCEPHLPMKDAKK